MTNSRTKHLFLPKQAIAKAFRDGQQSDQPVFIPYITAGYPNESATLDIALALQEEGASILELGFPYSDPLADGPVIQQSSQKALEQGMTFTKSLQMIKRLRDHGLTIPIVTFTYYNPVFNYGVERFILQAIKMGANGIIIPDLPREEGEELLQICQQNDFAYIPLVAPTSKARLEAIVPEATGFVYCVSSLGVTGVRAQFSDDLESFLEEVSRYAQVPLAVGFGISTREQVDMLSKKVQGIVIGSAIITCIAEQEQLFLNNDSVHEALAPLKLFVKQLFSR